MSIFNKGALYHILNFYKRRKDLLQVLYERVLCIIFDGLYTACHYIGFVSVVMFLLTLKCITSQNDQAHLKILAAFSVSFLMCLIILGLSALPVEYLS